MDSNEYIPVEKWGKDHWSTLAYIDTVMVDCAGFQVGYDMKMRHNRRNFRVMREQCMTPRRYGKHSVAPIFGVAMKPEHGTVLKNGSIVGGHDDWSCVQDMAVAGYFIQGVEDVEPGVILKFTELGQATANRVRAFKAKGGKFADYQESV